MAQDRHSYNGRLTGNLVWPIEWYDCLEWGWSLEVTFAVLNLYNTQNSGNIACFNSVCLHTYWKAHAVCLFLPARHYASADATAFPSVCLSVCHTRTLYQNG